MDSGDTTHSIRRFFIEFLGRLLEILPGRDVDHGRKAASIDLNRRAASNFVTFAQDVDIKRVRLAKPVIGPKVQQTPN